MGCLVEISFSFGSRFSKTGNWSELSAMKLLVSNIAMIFKYGCGPQT